MTRTQALAIAKARGLRVVNYDLHAVANETCRIRVRSGEAMLEIHTVLDANQNDVRNAKRSVRAQSVVGGSVLDAWDRCTPETKAAIDKHIVGYKYEVL